MSKNLSRLLEKFPPGKELLQDLQSLDSIQGSDENLSEKYKVGKANISGSRSFYDFLPESEREKKVFICSGTACMLAGTQEKVRQIIGGHFKHSEIGEICCLGRCHENGAFQLNGENYSGKSALEIENIVVGSDPDNYDVFHTESDLQDPVLLSSHKDIFEYKLLISSLLESNSEVILNEIKASFLRGRGGAGFPMAAKLEACKRADGQIRYVVCNADEGDPGSYSDRFLMEHRPNQVFFGMLVAAHVIGANTAIIYVRTEYPESVRILTEAAKIWNSSLNGALEFIIVQGAGSYVVGEETALMASIEGQRPEVRVRPPFPTENGLFGKPTVVNNVETFASLGYIFENGGDFYARLGTEKSKGTKLISLDGHFNRPGVYEVVMGTRLDYLIYKLGEGFKKPVKALHIGGPLGGVVPDFMFDQLTIDFESFKENGFELGHGSIVAIPEDFPMIHYLHHLFSFVSHESCGKCFPCRLGSQRGKELLESALSGQPIHRNLFDDLIETMKYGSLCGLGNGLPLPVMNILKFFGDELRPYFTNE